MECTILHTSKFLQRVTLSSLFEFTNLDYSRQVKLIVRCLNLFVTPRRVSVRQTEKHLKHRGTRTGSSITESKSERTKEFSITTEIHVDRGRTSSRVSMTFLSRYCWSSLGTMCVSVERNSRRRSLVSRNGRQCYYVLEWYTTGRPFRQGEHLLKTDARIVVARRSCHANCTRHAQA